MQVSVDLQAFRPASRIVTLDTDASPQSGTFHTRDRVANLKKLLQ